LHAADTLAPRVRVLPERFKRLEAEAIGIMPGAAVEFRNPVLIYSVSKDPSPLLHLACEECEGNF